MKCPNCGREYKREHTVCHAGTCGRCAEMVRDLRQHECVVMRLDSLAQKLQEFERFSCATCNQEFFEQRFLHVFEGKTLCAECFRKTAEKQQTLRDAVNGHLVSLDQTTCALCKLQVLEAPSTCLRPFELDHVDVFDKTCAVGTMCREGREWSQIVEECRKCRVLCARCHSAVTALQRRSGLLRLKRKHQAPTGLTTLRPDIDSLARLLIGKKKET